MLASTLPQPNEISKALQNSTRTVYLYLNFMQSNVVNSARASVHECIVCSNGCIAYVGLHLRLTECPKCRMVKPVSIEVSQLVHVMIYQNLPIFTLILLQFTTIYQYLLVFYYYLLMFYNTLF
jgi:hypothetical protein